MAAGIIEHFGSLPDPRQSRGRRHLLSDIVTITICAVICGADDTNAIAEFGEAKEQWFKSFLRLPHGIPSHDTFARVFSALEPEACENCFRSWVNALAASSKGGPIAIDGKTLRRSFDRAHGKAAIHMVSAWATANELCFAQLAIEAKSNEITAIPKLLELLDLKGATVTSDAMGCNKEIARQITDQSGDYVLALKANQGTLHDEVKVENKKRYVFLTNNFTLAPLTIARLYKCRWRVELFFKWIKQNLRIKACYGTSENAVKTEIWIAIGVYVLVAILKKELKIEHSLSEILQILSIAFLRKPIYLRCLQIHTRKRNYTSLVTH